MRSYRPYARDQSYLPPPSPSEWLPKGHLAYFVNSSAVIIRGDHGMPQP